MAQQTPSRILSHSSSSTLHMTRHRADSSALYYTALVSNHYTTPHQARIGYSVESIYRFSSSSCPISSFCLHYFFKALLVSKSEGTCFQTPTCGVEWVSLWMDGWLGEYVYRIGEQLCYAWVDQRVAHEPMGMCDCSYAASQFLI